MRAFHPVLSIALLASVGLAQAFSDYREEKGVREFTGTVIAKPLTLGKALEVAGDAKAALALRARSVSRVAPFSERYEADIDWYVVRVPLGLNENQYRDVLLATGEYELVEPNFRVYPCRDPNDPFYPAMWQHQAIRSAQAWDLWTGSRSFVLAITDTGCDKSHPDLTGAYVPGYNSVDDRAEVDGGLTDDVHGHGTHVAGCAAATGNNGIGVCGVGWNLRIMPIRVSNLPTGGSSYDQLFRGARWAVLNGAKVISASFAGVDSLLVEATGRFVRNAGGVYLYAAGNEGRELSAFDHENVIVVGATLPGDTRPGWSNYGRAVDVYAPGESIWSTIKGGGYAAWSGTSMSTPISNGVCSMIWSLNPDLSNEEVERILFISSRDLGPQGDDEIWGWGRVDLYSAVRRAKMPSMVLPRP